MYPRNYALIPCPDGWCPDCELRDDDCECPARPPARTPVQREAALARSFNAERKVAASNAYWAERLNA